MVRSALMIAMALAGSLCAVTAWAQDTGGQNQQPPATEPQVTEPQVSEPQPPQTTGDAVKAMIGAWELSDADRDKVCRLNFRADPAPGGYKLDVDKNCAVIFPSTKDMTGWAVDRYGNLSLIDGQGTAILELSYVEGGMYDGFRPEEGRYILQAAAAAPIQSADQMIGDWGIARGTGKPICLLTLAKAAAGADVFALKLKPGCDPLITSFNPVGWRIDQGELVLASARGQMWRFEENDANTWQRLPETPDPVLLVRQ